MGSQVFDNEKNRLFEAYEDSTSLEFGYLILDLLPFTDNNLRMRTNVFPGQDMIIYTSLDFKVDNIDSTSIHGNIK